MKLSPIESVYLREIEEEKGGRRGGVGGGAGRRRRTNKSDFQHHIDRKI
jgi:hypothetical protein